jgi:hypothetical protein|tara:strand:- start:3237 stop:3506 length:270 start_codon:yes stop_codon:yes gene_type:complete
MSLKITKKIQLKLKNILESQEYKIRFEKGNFKSGYCIIKDKKVAIINKYFSLEGKINALIEIIKSIEISKKLCTKNDIIILKKINTIES